MKGRDPLGCGVTHLRGCRTPQDPPDGEIARIAARQHGVVSLAQLEQAGIRRRSREIRLRRGLLHRLHRGVFAVGHLGLSAQAHWIAAVLAAGPEAFLSHTSAAALWGMLRLRRSAPVGRVRLPIHVTVRGHAESRRGIRVHRSRTLDPDQTTLRHGIPVTTPSRTLADLRRILPQPQFAEALRQAEYLRLPIATELHPDQTRSELESRFLAVCRRHRIPRPIVNAPVGPFTVDFLWPDRRLIIELDGYRAHGGRSAFEADRARDVELRMLGYEVVRFTWRQVTGHSRDVVRALRRFNRSASGGFNLSWELDFWGRFRRSIEAADASLQASVDNYDDVLVVLLSDVATDYIQYRTFQQRLDLAHVNVKVQEDAYSLASDSFKLGHVTERDPQQAKQVLEQTLR